MEQSVVESLQAATKAANDRTRAMIVEFMQERATPEQLYEIANLIAKLLRK